jgi:lipopolysaccharide transport system ATP-binding protein
MDSETAIEVTNLTKTFRIYHEKKNSVYEYLTSFFNKKRTSEELVVLKDVSFSVRKGEMLGIIGFNGSGKTTLLKIIAKIYTPDSGVVNTKGRITPFLELGTGFNGELTARDNTIIYGVILGLTKKEIEKKIESIVRFAELEKFLDTKLKNFSSGMNARLAFSTAIQVDPDIMLVDEVLSVGDLPFQEKSFNAFMDFKKRGKTIVFVSHTLENITRTCDKALWIHEGSIKAYGDPITVAEQYRTFSQKKS